MYSVRTPSCDRRSPMTSKLTSLGIIGGTGQLGAAIAHALLKSNALSPERLWIANRSGTRGPFAEWPDVHITADNQALADACDVILLSVPPALFPAVQIAAENRLVLSVMAGVTIAQIARQTGARRIIRAMSSPAAELSLAYSPWCASPAVTEQDRKIVRILFEACGKTDEVASEDQIDYFTALTGPVPGFVAYFADCMIADAIGRGVPAEIAERAVRQLFHAAGIGTRQRRKIARRACRGDDRLCRNDSGRHACHAPIEHRSRDRAGA